MASYYYLPIPDLQKLAIKYGIDTTETVGLPAKKLSQLLFSQLEAAEHHNPALDVERLSGRFLVIILRFTENGVVTEFTSTEDEQELRDSFFDSLASRELNSEELDTLQAGPLQDYIARLLSVSRRLSMERNFQQKGKGYLIQNVIEFYPRTIMTVHGLAT